MRISGSRLVALLCLTVALMTFVGFGGWYKANWYSLYGYGLRTEAKLALVFVAIAAFAFLFPAMVSFVRSCYHGEGVKTSRELTYKSIEERRKKRLPLGRRISALPDKSAVGGSLMLLIGMFAFIMVTTPPFPAKGLYVTLPPVSIYRAPSNYEPAPLIRVEGGYKKETRYFVNDKEVMFTDLRPCLQEKLSRQPQWFVYIYGESNIPLQEVASVIDVVNGMGARPVLWTARFAVEPKH